MQAIGDIEDLARQVATMDRQAALERLLRFEGDFPMDFTAEFLDSLPDERLRHLLLAAYLHHRNKRRAAQARAGGESV